MVTTTTERYREFVKFLQLRRIVIFEDPPSKETENGETDTDGGCGPDSIRGY